MHSSFSFSENTLGFLVDGVLDKKRVKKINKEILDKIERYGKINLYLEDDGIENFTLPALVKEISFKIKHADRLNRVALVSNERWVDACAGIQNFLLSTDVKTFSTKNRLRAMSWIVQAQGSTSSQ
jgi:SpoIIAA-like